MGFKLPVWVDRFVHRSAVTMRPEMAAVSAATGIKVDRELPRECASEEQQALLTTKPLLQPHF